MGEFSEAISDGDMCPVCFSWLIDETGQHFKCDCVLPERPKGPAGFEKRTPENDKLGPNWLPPLRR